MKSTLALVCATLSGASALRKILKNIGLTYLVVYRLNTYPIIHTGFFHAFLNALALTPLLERFEAEHGTLTSIALFVGREYLYGLWRIDLDGEFAAARFLWSCPILTRFLPIALSTLPAGLYILIEKVILHRNTQVVGSR
jgi:glycosylphosphatidylinositol transamidase